MPSSPPLNQNGNDVDDTVEELENLIGDSYNNVNLSGAGTDLEFFSPNGGTTAVKSITLPTGTGTGQNFEAFNSVSESLGVYTFGTNYGNFIGTTIDIGGITTNSASISGLSTTVTGHTTAIDDVEAAIETQVSIEVPFDFPEFDMTSNTTTVNGVTYIASGSNSNPWKGYSTSSEYKSSAYETLIGTKFDYGGSEGDHGVYDYAGTDNLGTGAVDGSWLKLQLPEPRAISSFKIRNRDNEEDCVLGWNIYASSNDSDWTLLGTYLTDWRNMPTNQIGGNTYDLDSTLAGYGQLYSYYAIVFTRVFGGEWSAKAYAKLREIRFIGGTRLASHVGAVSRTNTLNISTLEQRDKYRDIHEHPDLHDECYLAHLHDNNKSLTVNGRTYTFTSSSHYLGSQHHYEYHAFMDHTGYFTSEQLWESDGNTYNTVDGDYRNYSGSASLGGISGEWLQVKLPEPILLNSFKLRSCYVGDGGIPRSFTIIASNDGTNYDTIQTYSDVSVSITTAETLFHINSTASNYGNKYSYYAIVITRIDPNPNLNIGYYFRNVLIRRWRLFSVNDDVADCIKKTDESFNNATITGTNTLNLISDSGTTSLTLPGGTTAATSVDAITFNLTVQTVADGSNKYFLNGMQGSEAPLELLFMHKYIFTFPTSHPLKLSRTPDGTHAGGTEWTTGVTVDSPTQITFVNQGTRILENLYYYCGNHSGMGGTIIEENGYNNITEIDYNTTTAIPQLEVTRAHGNVITHLDHIPLSDSFVQAQKDGDNIKLTSITGVETSIGPFSSGAASSTTNYPELALTSNGGFSGTPPSTITLTGTWGSSGYNYQPLSHTTGSVIYHMVNTANNVPFGGYGIVFTIVSNQLTLYVNDLDHGYTEPTSFSINGNAASEGDVVNGNDTIALILSNSNVTDTFTVPTELIPNAITTSSSTEYNLFTDKKFGTDNLGNLGEIDGDHVGTAGPVEYWAFDPSDENVIVAFIDGTNLKMIKITQDGNLSSVTYPERYISTPSPLPATAADLISHWNSYSGSGGHLYTFTKHALFDLAVNNSPAFKAFDEVSTSEWVSHSNKYDVTTGDYVGGVSEPQTKLSSNAGAGGYSCSASSVNAGSTTSQPFEPFMAFEGNSSPAANTWVSATGSYLSGAYNGSNSIVTTTGTASGEYIILNMPHALKLSAVKLAGQYTTGTPPRTSAPKGWSVYGKNSGNWELIQHFTNSIPGNGLSTYNLTTPSTIAYQSFAIVITESNGDTQVCISEIEFVGLPALGALTDVGEYLKISLDSSVEATTLNLKSAAEYKEPRFNMSDYNQCGYEVSASSEASSYNAYRLFDNLTTGLADFGASSSGFWLSPVNTYVSSGGEFISTGTQLATATSIRPPTVTGEWIKLKLPDKRKLVGYKLTRPDYTFTDETPKKFRIYGSNDDSNWSEISGSSQDLTTPIESYVTTSPANPINTGGTRFDITGGASPAYQYYALVIETTFNFTHTVLMEMQLFCEPSEIEEFKLYASPDEVAWTEIHSQTSANITSSGTDFAIDSPGSYQHYGLVITKNYGYNNVSLSELKLKATSNVDLTNYYTKVELDPRIARAKGTFFKDSDGLSTGTGANTLKNAYKVTFDSQPYYNGILTATMWGGLNTTYAIFDHRFNFEANLFNDDEEYQVILSPSSADIASHLSNRIMSMEVNVKNYQYFEVRTMVWEDIANFGNSNLPWGFDFVVF